LSCQKCRQPKHLASKVGDLAASQNLTSMQTKLNVLMSERLNKITSAASEADAIEQYVLHTNAGKQLP